MIFLPYIPGAILLVAGILLIVFTIFCIARKSLRKTRIFRRIGILALILLVLARPVIAGGHSERSLSNINVFFIVDNTGSMAAQDLEQGSKRRYEKVAEDIKAIADLFPGAKFGIIVADYDIRRALPLVNDINAVYAYADSLKPKPSALSASSNLSELLNYSADHIKRYNTRFPERSSVVFVMSDGEDSDTESVNIPSELKDAVAGGAVIGYGTTNGSKLPVIDRDGNISEYSLIKDARNEEVVSRIDEANLKQISQTLGLKYYNRMQSNDIFNNSENFVDIMMTYRKADTDVSSYEDLYWILMIAAIALLLWDLYEILNTLMRERKAVK